MAISVYTGVMGSGKSFEAVKTGVLGALVKGRRVVTNITGLNQDRCLDYLVKKGHKRENLGTVVVVTNSRVSEPNFFPSEDSAPFRFDVPDFVPLRELRFYGEHYTLNTGKNFTRTVFQLMLPHLKRLADVNKDIGSCLVEAATREWKGFDFEYFRDRPCGEVFAEIPDSGPSVVQPGDFVVIDEAWRYWSDANMLSPEHMNFFRMHRHYVDEKGQTCDLLVLIQDFGSLNRFLRGVCELVLIFYKMKSLGLMSRYRVEVYEGKPRKATLTSRSVWQKYDKAIFPLYQSYDGNQGKETATDDRQNLFKNKRLMFFFAVVLIGFIWSSSWFYSYLAKMTSGGKKDATSPAVTSMQPPPGRVGAPGGSGAASKPVSSRSDSSLVGLVQLGSEAVAFIRQPDGRVFTQRLDAGILDGWQSVVMQDGQQVGFSFGNKSK